MPRQGPPPGQNSPPQGGGTPPQAIYQCYGPVGTLTEGQWKFGHGGGNPVGISTSVDFYPETDWVVVILGNYPDPTVMLIADLARTLIVTA